MSVQAGDRIPDVSLWKHTSDGIVPVPARSVFAGRRIVLFAVPGAFTPTCNDAHLPGYVMHAADLRDKGIHGIVCVAVNDAHVLNAWSKTNHAGEIEFYSDGNSDFTRAMGLTLDLSGIGLGIRSQRYAAVVEDGLLTRLFVEPGRGVSVSGAEAVLAQL